VQWFEMPHAPAAGAALGVLADFPDGGVRMLSYGPQGANEKPFRLLVLRSDGAVLCYVNRCAHFGVPLAASEDKLVFKPHVSISCNVHYARYRWADGVCEFGDCEGEALIAVPLAVSAGQVVIGD
jgi:nitrite reductase/ring-hydroxylating ferredoxin subunit